MDRIAIISDIHGNLPALQAVLNDIRLRGIERIFCLGDLVGKGPHSDVVVDIVREQCEQVICGNWDEFIREKSKVEAIVWHQQILGSNRLAYLETLPFCIEFMMYVRKFEELKTFMKKKEDDVFVFGDDDESGMALYLESGEYMLRTEETTNATIGLTVKQAKELAKKVSELAESIVSLDEEDAEMDE